MERLSAEPGNSRERTFLNRTRMPSKIFSVVAADWPWPAFLRTASTPLSVC